MIEPISVLAFVVSSIASGVLLALVVLWISRPGLNARSRFALLWLGLVLVIGLAPAQWMLWASKDHPEPPAEAMQLRASKAPNPEADEWPARFESPELVLRAGAARQGTERAALESPQPSAPPVPDVQGGEQSSGESGVESRPDAARGLQSLLQLPLGRRLGLALVVSVFGLWASGATWRLLRLAGALAHARRLKAAAQPWPSGDERMARWRQACPTRRRVRVGLSDEIRCPVALGFFTPAILFPRGLDLRLSEGEIDQLGVHELAHLRRWDDWSRLAQKLLESVLWLHPGVLLLCRRLDFERELACDDVAIDLTRAPRTYARCLAHLIEATSPRAPRAPDHRAVAIAAGAVGKRSQTTRRITMLLRTERKRSLELLPVRLGAAALVIAAMAAGLLLAPPLLSLEPETSLRGLLHDTDGDRTHLRWSEDGRRLELWMRGEVVFNSEHTDIASISRGGYLKVRERDGLRVRSVRVSPGATGLDYQYASMGLNADYDADAQSWFARTLQLAIDRSGIAARQQATELLASGGAEAVIEHIPTLRADRSKQITYAVLLEQAELTPEQLIRVGTQVRQEIETEHLLADVFTRLAEQGWLPSVAADDYFAAVRALPSDHRRHHLLELAIEEEGVAADQVERYFDVLEDLTAEHRRAHFLDVILDESEHTVQTLLLAIDALELLPAEHRRHAVLVRLADRVAIDRAVTDAFFGAMNDLPAEHRRDELLRLLLEQDDEWLSVNADRYLAAVQSLTAEHRRDELLTKLWPRFRRIEEDRLLLGLLDGVAALSAEHRVSAFLERMLDERDLSDEVLSEMLQLTKDRVPSQHRRGPLVESITERLLG